MTRIDLGRVASYLERKLFAPGVCGSDSEDDLFRKEIDSLPSHCSWKPTLDLT